jgi:hypothetical protein
MKQMSLDSTTGFERKTKRTRKREFLDEMNLVVPWAELVALIAPHAPTRKPKGGRPPFAVATLLRIHFLQEWFNLSDPAMEKALYDTPMFREFAGLDLGEDHLPDESTILRFRHLLEAHNLSLQILATVNATLSAKGLLLKQGTVVDATRIAAPTSTKNSTGTRLRCTRPRRATSGITARRRISARMLTRAWCTAWRPLQLMPMMSHNPMLCCTVKKPMFLPTRAIGVLRSAKKSSPNTPR